VTDLDLTGFDFGEQGGEHMVHCPDCGGWYYTLRFNGCPNCPVATEEVIATIDEFPTDQPLVADFSVIVDTREQAPFRFTGIKNDKNQDLIIPLVNRGLATGDYSIDGLETLVSVERKSLRDFYGSISRERERFEREVCRLNEMRVAYVVIESDWNDILNPESFTKVTAKTATRTMQSWSIKYPRVHWMPCPSRRFAEVWTYRFLEMFWRQWRHEQSESAVK
jgi:hypothetical protein